MLGGVGHGLVDLLGQLLHRAFALGEDVDELCAAPVGQRLGRLGQRVVQGGLCLVIRHLVTSTHSIQDFS